MISGFIAVVGFAGEVLLNKYELSRRRLPISIFLPASFLLLCFMTGVIMMVFKDASTVSPLALTWPYILAFAAMVILACVWNVMYCQALSKETIQEFDLIIMTEPLVTIALAGLLFNAERNAIVFLLALIAAIVLILAHVRRKRLKFTHYAKELIIAIFMMSLEVVIIRQLLSVYSPISLYFWRTFAVFAIFFWLFRPDFTKIKITDFGALGLVGAFGVMQMIARFYGYEIGGVVLTTLILLLGPVLVELVSIMLLREKVSLRIAAAFVVILVCIGYAGLAGIVH